MRTGLVVVGAALAVIGGGLFVTLFFVSAGPALTTRLSFDNPDIPAHGSWPEVMSRSTTSSAAISIVWSTNFPANVSLTPAYPCNSSLGVCPMGTPLFAWDQSLSGKETGTTGNATAFILVVGNPGGATLAFTGTVSVGFMSSSPLPSWAWGLIALGGVVLLSLGGIALFLGLFLPGGVYRESAGADLRLRRPPDPPEEDLPPP